MGRRDDRSSSVGRGSRARCFAGSKATGRGGYEATFDEISPSAHQEPVCRVALAEDAGPISTEDDDGAGGMESLHPASFPPPWIGGWHSEGAGWQMT
ncbi:hypothetical protein DCS_03768 [Drechmeria coniospora]|uniref:Uncharacterized protein n=1 Tax=Drechmeria coniospora TaxID=98403 RepID=A0A151GIA3_DRECN|nr:hypothetical protein DCS_03768 [Drechmeria coniospora]KYK56762.1 hypothetical protein DCS_03768 [Drechmeria coniospora]